MIINRQQRIYLKSILLPYLLSVGKSEEGWKVPNAKISMDEPGLANQWSDHLFYWSNIVIIIIV